MNNITSPASLHQAAVDLGIRGYYVAPLQPRKKSQSSSPVSSNTASVTPYAPPAKSGTTGGAIPPPTLPSTCSGQGAWASARTLPNGGTASWNRFNEWGLPETMTARSGGGDGHLHYYYRRSQDCPPDRINRPPKYDIPTDGYFVAPPSIHPSGNSYAWLTPLQYVADLPEAPVWAVEMVLEHFGGAGQANSEVVDTGAITIAGGDTPVRLYGAALERWTGVRYARSYGVIDTGKTLFNIGLVLASANATEPVIAQAVGERGRIRRPGGGRKRTVEHDPSLREDLD